MLAHKSGSGPVPRSEPHENGEETSLLARVAAGEGEAFRGLVDRHLPTVLAIARRMLRDDAEAEDVAQETMLRLWRNAAGLELGPNGVRPWLRPSPRILCIDRVRARRNTTVVEEVPEESAPPTQFRHLAERELGARVDAALQALPERQRLAITLFHYEGMSQIEVGERAGHIGRGGGVAAGAGAPHAQGGAEGGMAGAHSGGRGMRSHRGQGR